jgi:predicted DCC family thiol-disulfide oxidoreductase YuxK
MVFRSLWSDEGKAYLEHYDLPAGYNESLVYICKNKAYLKSTATLRITRKMKGLFPALSIFLIIPAPLRDWVYIQIANHRHLIR